MNVDVRYSFAYFLSLLLLFCFIFYHFIVFHIKEWEKAILLDFFLIYIWRIAHTHHSKIQSK